MLTITSIINVWLICKLCVLEEFFTATHGNLSLKLVVNKATTSLFKWKQDEMNKTNIIR